MTRNNMSIRPLDLRDLPTLARYRNEAVPLDMTRLLTRGNPLGARGFLSYFNPARHVYAAVADGNAVNLVGGVIHTRGESSARLNYLAPASSLDHPELPGLVENLSAQAGTWGAFHITAEVEEDSPAFPALRAAGFAVYAWQRIWEISKITGSASSSDWRRVSSVQWPAVQSLYNQIVPPLLQPIESLPKEAGGLMCNEGARCYVSMERGNLGLVLTPLIHPEAADVSEKIAALADRFPNTNHRPIYLRVRSYQAWLEPVLEDLGAHAANRQAVMVKHLARMIKSEQPVLAKQPGAATMQPTRVTRAGYYGPLARLWIRRGDCYNMNLARDILKTGRYANMVTHSR